ncbi:hypothetical protein AABB24_005336, partial [Solanum stoloniferum]
GVLASVLYMSQCGLILCLPYTRSASLAALRMLSSSTAFSPNPNLPISSLHCTMKATSELPTNAPNFPFFSNPKITITNLPQNLAPSNCFSATGATNPVPILKANASRNEEVEGSGLSSESQLVVVSFYKFADFPDHADLRKPLKELCEKLAVLFLHLKESMAAYVVHGIQWKLFLHSFKVMSV